MQDTSVEAKSKSGYVRRFSVNAAGHVTDNTSITVEGRQSGGRRYSEVEFGTFPTNIVLYMSDADLARLGAAIDSRLAEAATEVTDLERAQHRIAELEQELAATKGQEQPEILKLPPPDLTPGGLVQFGVWSASLPGFISTGWPTPEQAWDRLDHFVAGGKEYREALSVVEICPDHLEQPRLGCSECDPKAGEL